MRTYYLDPFLFLFFSTNGRATFTGQYNLTYFVLCWLGLGTGMYNFDF